MWLLLAVIGCVSATDISCRPLLEENDAWAKWLKNSQLKIQAMNYDCYCSNDIQRPSSFQNTRCWENGRVPNGTDVALVRWPGCRTAVMDLRGPHGGPLKLKGLIISPRFPQGFEGPKAVVVVKGTLDLAWGLRVPENVTLYLDRATVRLGGDFRLEGSLAGIGNIYCRQFVGAPGSRAFPGFGSTQMPDLLQERTYGMLKIIQRDDQYGVLEFLRVFVKHSRDGTDQFFVSRAKKLPPITWLTDLSEWPSHPTRTLCVGDISSNPKVIDRVGLSTACRDFLVEVHFPFQEVRDPVVEPPKTSSFPLVTQKPARRLSSGSGRTWRERQGVALPRIQTDALRNLVATNSPTWASYYGSRETFRQESLAACGKLGYPWERKLIPQWCQGGRLNVEDEPDPLPGLLTGIVVVGQTQSPLVYNKDAPCANGGTRLVGGLCQCLDGFTGVLCEDIVCPNDCGGVIRGVCQLVNGSPKCACSPNFSGSACEIASCTPLCANNGTCDVSTGVPRCTCPFGWAGPTCTWRTSVPDGPAKGPNQVSSPCQNGGIYVSDTQPETCTCPPMWGGVTCDLPVCVPGCGKSGVCTSSPQGTSQCQCATGWTGPGCVQQTCAATSCLNGGSCTMQASTGSPTCNCQRGFIGKSCQTPDPLVSRSTEGGGGVGREVWIPILVIGLLLVGAIIAVVIFLATRAAAKKRTSEMRQELVQKMANGGV